MEILCPLPGREFQMTASAPKRRYEFDWIRLFAIFIVFVYHSSRFFNLGEWHVKNSDTYVWVEIWNVFATRWMMPLFFVISGASLFFVMGKAAGFRKFYVDKFLRLMIPVLVGCVTHAALQIYLEKVTHGQFSGSFFAFLPQYFSSIYFAINMPGNFAFHGMHLWYLLFLFVYGLITYPLFVWLKGGGKRFLDRVTRVLSLPGVMILGFALPLIIMEALIPAAALSIGAGGWGFLHYIWFLIAGFILVSSERLQNQIKAQRWVSLFLALVLMTALLFQLFSPSRVNFPVEAGDAVNTLLSIFSAWCWLLAILGLGMRFLSFDHPWRKPANEGVLPFFILHQTILLVIGFFVVNWEIHDALKWAIISVSAFVLILAIYRLLIQRADLLRFLFGMTTTRPFFSVFRKRAVIFALHAAYIGLILFAAAGTGKSLSPMPLTYDPDRDILLDSGSISHISGTGVRVVQDPDAAMGRAIAFYDGASQRAQAQPVVYLEMVFSAPAGYYTIWVRGKTDVDNGYTDSVWLQADDHIATEKGVKRLGNWLDAHPAGAYAWASDSRQPITIQLKHDGRHKIRIQPRQTPHRIDQIWLSRSQHRIPDTREPIAAPAHAAPSNAGAGDP